MSPFLMRMTENPVPSERMSVTSKGSDSFTVTVDVQSHGLDSVEVEVLLEADQSCASRVLSPAKKQDAPEPESPDIYHRDGYSPDRALFTHVKDGPEPILVSSPSSKMRSQRPDEKLSGIASAVDSSIAHDSKKSNMGGESVAPSPGTAKKLQRALDNPTAAVWVSPLPQNTVGSHISETSGECASPQMSRIIADTRSLLHRTAHKDVHGDMHADHGGAPRPAALARVFSEYSRESTPNHTCRAQTRGAIDVDPAGATAQRVSDRSHRVKLQVHQPEDGAVALTRPSVARGVDSDAEELPFRVLSQHIEPSPDAHTAEEPRANRQPWSSAAQSRETGMLDAAKPAATVRVSEQPEQACANGQRGTAGIVMSTGTRHAIEPTSGNEIRFAAEEGDAVRSLREQWAAARKALETETREWKAELSRSQEEKQRPHRLARTASAEVARDVDCEFGKLEQEIARNGQLERELVRSRELASELARSQDLKRQLALAQGLLAQHARAASSGATTAVALERNPSRQRGCMTPVDDGSARQYGNTYQVLTPEARFPSERSIVSGHRTAPHGNSVFSGRTGARANARDRDESPANSCVIQEVFSPKTLSPKSAIGDSNSLYVADHVAPARAPNRKNYHQMREAPPITAAERVAARAAGGSPARRGQLPMQSAARDVGQRGRLRTRAAQPPSDTASARRSPSRSVSPTAALVPSPSTCPRCNFDLTTTLAPSRRGRSFASGSPPRSAPISPCVTRVRTGSVERPVHAPARHGAASTRHAPAGASAVSHPAAGRAPGSYGYEPRNERARAEPVSPQQARGELHSFAPGLLRSGSNPALRRRPEATAPARPLKPQPPIRGVQRLRTVGSHRCTRNMVGSLRNPAVAATVRDTAALVHDRMVREGTCCVVPETRERRSASLSPNRLIHPHAWMPAGSPNSQRLSQIHRGTAVYSPRGLEFAPALSPEQRRAALLRQLHQSGDHVENNAGVLSPGAALHAPFQPRRRSDHSVFGAAPHRSLADPMKASALDSVAPLAASRERRLASPPSPSLRRIPGDTAAPVSPRTTENCCTASPVCCGSAPAPVDRTADGAAARGKESVSDSSWRGVDGFPSEGSIASAIRQAVQEAWEKHLAQQHGSLRSAAETPLPLANSVYAKSAGESLFQRFSTRINEVRPAVTRAPAADAALTESPMPTARHEALSSPLRHDHFAGASRSRDSQDRPDFSRPSIRSVPVASAMQTTEPASCTISGGADPARTFASSPIGARNVRPVSSPVQNSSSPAPTCLLPTVFGAALGSDERCSAELRLSSDVAPVLPPTGAPVIAAWTPARDGRGEDRFVPWTPGQHHATVLVEDALDAVNRRPVFPGIGRVDPAASPLATRPISAPVPLARSPADTSPAVRVLPAPAASSSFQVFPGARHKRRLSPKESPRKPPFRPAGVAPPPSPPRSAQPGHAPGIKVRLPDDRYARLLTLHNHNLAHPPNGPLASPPRSSGPTVGFRPPQCNSPNGRRQRLQVPAHIQSASSLASKTVRNDSPRARGRLPKSLHSAADSALTDKPVGSWMFQVATLRDESRRSFRTSDRFNSTHDDLFVSPIHTY